VEDAGDEREEARDASGIACAVLVSVALQAAEPAVTQKTFATPEEAVEALVAPPKVST
jgi:hypothetical protein